VFARDPDTGEAVWFYQMSPHDLFDWDGINEDILLDLDWHGTKRKVLIRPDRNGYVYVMDRATGQVLSATPYVYINSTTQEHVFVRTRTVRLPYQAPGFGIECRIPAAHPEFSTAGTPYIGADVKYYAGPGGNMGELTAWDPINAKPVWAIKDKYPIWSGTVVTAGDLVFFGTMDGWFKAADARNGKILWQFKTGSGIIGQPVTYRGPDGKQYVAILSGIGGWPGAIVSNDLDTRDDTAANGWGSAMRDLSSVTTKGGTLYVFALP
jgi:glucose dehydrogenase